MIFLKHFFTPKLFVYALPSPPSKRPKIFDILKRNWKKIWWQHQQKKRVVSQTVFVWQDKLCKAAPDPRLSISKILDMATLFELSQDILEIDTHSHVKPIS